MTRDPRDNGERADLPPALDGKTLAALLAAVTLGALAAAVIAPAWAPNLVASLLGAQPKAYWYLSRASALVAYTLVWLSMALGLLITNKLARLWPGGPAAYDLHQYTSLLGLAFGLFHALILVGDRYIGYSVAQVLVPFANTHYKPAWVGLGQVAFYGLALVGLSFYVRGWIGQRLWRAIHFLSFLVFALALGHGLFSGTDTAASLVGWFYWATGGSLVFLTIYRGLAAAIGVERAPTPGRAEGA